MRKSGVICKSTGVTAERRTKNESIHKSGVICHPTGIRKVTLNEVSHSRRQMSGDDSRRLEERTVVIQASHCSGQNR
jgi:hypothetical protein